jgi:DNA-binding CsgD family transcriptional regulator
VASLGRTAGPHAGSPGGRGFAQCWDEGLTLSLDAAMELAAGREAPPLKQARYGLTGREVAVLRLIGDGLTNRQIGQRLFISTGTAAVHVSNILHKLGVSGRVQAATIAHHLGLSAQRLPGAHRRAAWLRGSIDVSIGPFSR